MVPAENEDAPVNCLRLRFATAALAVVGFVTVGGNEAVFACAMCFGAEETSLINATKLGIVVMLGITLAVQGAFVGFFLHLRRHAKREADIELETEWSELQRSPRT